MIKLCNIINIAINFGQFFFIQIGIIYNIRFVNGVFFLKELDFTWDNLKNYR